MEFTCRTYFEKKQFAHQIFLWRYFKQGSRQPKRTLYFSFVRSILEYACTVWDPHTRVLTGKIEEFQDCARFVVNKYGIRESATAMKYILLIESAVKSASKTLLFHLPLWNNNRENKVPEMSFLCIGKSRQFIQSCNWSLCHLVPSDFFVRSAVEWNMLPQMSLPVYRLPSLRGRIE